MLFRSSGGQVETGRWVRSLADLPPAPAILLDVAPRGFLTMAGERLPSRYRDALARYRYGAGICKVDFALSGPVPWQNDAARQAGTLHLGGGFEEIAAAEAAVARGQHPDSPYVLVVQACVADPTRAPEGQHTLWAYCHVPSGSDVDMTPQVEAQIERFAPGFRDLILARATRTATGEEAHNPNYVGGDIAAGMQTITQQHTEDRVRGRVFGAQNATAGLVLVAAGPERVAGAIERAITADRPRARYVVTPTARLMIEIHRLLPGRAFDMLMRTQFPTPGGRETGPTST